MPSTMVHLFTADKIASALEINDISQFFLGSVSPDAVNLNGFASQEVRYAAHIRSIDPEVWKNNVSEFYRKNLSAYINEIDFFKGFIVHLLTDIAWDEFIQPDLFEGLRRSGITEDNLRKEKWVELDRLDDLLLSDSRFEFIRSRLSASHPVAVSTVSQELLEKFKEHILIQTNKKKSDEKPVVLKYEHIEAVSKKVLELYNHVTDVPPAE